MSEEIKYTTKESKAVALHRPCSAFDRWTAGDGDEDAKLIAWEAGRAPLLKALREINEIASRHKRASDIKQYLLADLESIERLSEPNDKAEAPSLSEVDPPAAGSHSVV